MPDTSERNWGLGTRRVQLLLVSQGDVCISRVNVPKACRGKAYIRCCTQAKRGGCPSKLWHACLSRCRPWFYFFLKSSHWGPPACCRSHSWEIEWPLNKALYLEFLEYMLPFFTNLNKFRDVVRGNHNPFAARKGFGCAKMHTGMLHQAGLLGGHATVRCAVQRPRPVPTTTRNISRSNANYSISRLRTN